MMRLLFVVGVIATAIGICALAVRGGDRELVVPPPDAVGEGFFREVTTHRYPRAADFVVETNADEEAIRRLAYSIEQRMGRVDDVKAETIRRTQEKALVSVRLKSAEASNAIPLGLVWSNGAWRVERVP